MQELAAESGPDGVWWTASAREMELFGDHPFNTRGDDGEAAPSGDYAAGLAVLRERVDAFSSWLAARPEATVLVVGHGATFSCLLGQMLANCELQEGQWPPSFFPPQLRTVSAPEGRSKL